MEVPSVMRLLLVVAVCCVLLATPIYARPPHRQKRVSDQRLAELETLLALAKMNNRKYVTLPVGFGLIDVKQIGRRKRSVDAVRGEYDVNDLLADLTSSIREGGSNQEDVPYASSADLPLGLGLLDEREDRLRAAPGDIHTRDRQDAPAVIFGLDGVPHRRFI